MTTMMKIMKIVNDGDGDDDGHDDDNLKGLRLIFLVFFSKKKEIEEQKEDRTI